MNKLDQSATASGQLFPYPSDGETVYENPPTLCWRKVDGISEYTVILRSEGFERQYTTSNSYVVPNEILTGREYEWNVTAGDCERGFWRFTVAEDAEKFLRPDPMDIYNAVPDVRPRELFYTEDIPSIKASHAAALETLKRNVELAYKDGLPQPPMFHMDENALPYREYFGRHRDFCDRDMVACALAYHLLKDEKAGAHAKALLLTICSWNSEGPCSLEGPWGDELGLSHARCLPAVFDMLYELLDEKQRIFVARVVAAYAMQCERRLKNLDFCANPGSSHAGRLPAYLGEAAMVLKGTGAVPEETLIRWLKYAVEIYGGMFPYYGCSDGGWAEGTFYATSYTKWYLPFFCAVERFSGVSFFRRPFYRRYARYLQHFCPPNWENHPFGDGYWCKPSDIEWPGFFAQNPYHIYAERWGSKLIRKWSKDAQQQEIFLLHLLDVFLPENESADTEPVTRAGFFPESGYISLHTDPEHGEKDIAVVAHATKFGTGSHRHADNGSFALMAGGTALISPSGYFGRQYGTKHHFDYTNQSKAHNTILIDGIGQLSFSHLATGKPLYARDEGNRLTAKLDCTQAYPQLEKWTREFVLENGTLTVSDEIVLKEEAEITYLLHTLSKPELSENGITVDRNGKRLRIVPESGDLHDPVISDEFDVPLNEGVPEEYAVTMPPQYHIRYTAPKRKVHLLSVRFCVSFGE